MALVASAYAGQVSSNQQAQSSPCHARQALRSGTRWLSFDERSSLDAELDRLVARTDPQQSLATARDPQLGELAAFSRC